MFGVRSPQLCKEIIPNELVSLFNLFSIIFKNLFSFIQSSSSVNERFNILSFKSRIRSNILYIQVKKSPKYFYFYHFQFVYQLV
jgi:hypothetical protein